MVPRAGHSRGPKSCEFGQTGLGLPAVCDVGNGLCRPDAGDGTTSGGNTWVNPSQVHLDPTKRYYISVLPGDGADPFEGADVGHGMGGAPIAAANSEHFTSVAPSMRRAKS